jgi:hypothetical protein
MGIVSASGCKTASEKEKSRCLAPILGTVEARRLLRFRSRIVKKFDRYGNARLAASTSLFALLGTQDEFLDPTGSVLSLVVLYRHVVS